MTMLMALLLAMTGNDADETPTLAELSLPRSLAWEEQESKPGYQDPRPRAFDHEPAGSSREKESSAKFGLSLGIQGRWTSPFGSANRDVYYVDNPAGGLTLLFDSNLRWNDVFSSGWGTSITAEITFLQAGRGGGEGRGRGKFSAGMYVSFMQDHFSGDNVSDGHGNSFSVDDLTMNTYIVGGSMYQSLGGGSFVDGRMGIGAVHYAAVDADYNFLFTPKFRGGFLEDTWNFATELRGGYGYRFGPFAVTLGLGFRFLLPPNEAGTVSLDSGALMTFDIDLGFEIGF